MTFPVAVAAKLNRIPVVVHESDFIPGLANKLVFPFAEKICVTFEETKKNIKDKNKIVVTGAPIRQEFFQGNKESALKLLNTVFANASDYEQRINNFYCPNGTESIVAILNSYL